MSKLIFIKNETEFASVDSEALSHMEYTTVSGFPAVALYFDLSKSGVKTTLEVKLLTTGSNPSDVVASLTSLFARSGQHMFTNIGLATGKFNYDGTAKVSAGKQYASDFVTSVSALTFTEGTPTTGPQGPPGPAGQDGQDGQDGQNGQDGQDGQDGQNGTNGSNGTNGTNGSDGADGADGQGVPTGGSTGQVLKKTSGTDYDTEWGDVAEPLLPLAALSGRYTWSSVDDGERVLTGSTTYGPLGWYNWTTEPLALSQADQMRSYSGSEVSGTTTGTIYGYYLFAFGIKNPYTGKKVRVDYNFRIYASGSAPTSGTPFGISLWSGNALATGSSTSTSATYRAESVDCPYGSTTSHHHGSFTTSSALDDDYLFICAEHRNSTGLNGTTYMPAQIAIYMVD